MKLTSILLLCGTIFTSIEAHPAVPSDPTEIVYTENFIPGSNDPHPLFTLPSSQGRRIGYDLRAMLQGFVICETTPASPLVEEAVAAIQSLRARVHVPAQQDSVELPFCTNLTTNGRAITAICGPQGTWMKSKDAGKMADQIYRRCKSEQGGEMRLGGMYVFNEGTEPKSFVKVYHARDTELEMEMD